ncbi:hypothetical protein KFK09_000395 [Dendrobium nobile]|uniref:Reverse transcriptase domain-containing protein n=1 Tax=Dendrobium nobile TaxID=94219 RepID=A0A8T3CD16_DENNO|nr:hypothetical protein KFK09_000395 [Dendrobium nobile]
MATFICNPFINTVKGLKESRAEQNITDTMYQVNKKDNVEGNNVLALESRDEHEECFGKENSETVVTNKFAVLSENTEEIFWLSSAAVKVKLAKELKSLGPVDVNHKKKKRNMVSFDIRETSSQVIVGSLSVPNLGIWRIATVYGSRNCKERESLWKQLQDCMVDAIPSIIGGDFNCIVNKEEKREGKRFLFSKGPREMKSFMTDYGDEYSILQRKLKRTMKALFFWNKNKCKDLNVLKETLKREILDLQNREACDVNWNSDDLVLLRNKVHELNVTLRRLSAWWNQRAKVRWHEEGDINSSFFQNFASARHNDNRINQITDEFNTLHVEDNQIEKVFTNFFEKKWKHRECELTGCQSTEEIQKLNNADLGMLNEEFSVQELQILVFQQGNNKAPGIDGVTSSFYKSYWSIVWEVLWNAIKCFFKTCILNREWKDTLITLISKVKYPLLPSNYRPISLCQTNYKIVASMLVNRLKKVIDKMVYEEKAAFIPGRSISEHFLLAQEIFHKFKLSKNKKGLMALKLDMEQAYDSMGWSTLHQVLKWYGFPTLFSNLLMECVVDVRFSIIINGRNSNWICAKSGFRQGCPLSPYLFIMCSQLLSNSLEKRGKDLGIRISPKGPRITHLLYADDVLIFSHVSITLAKELKKIVEEFCKWTGQRVNINKSQILFGKMVSYPLKKKITRIISFKEVKEMKYLGVKISLRRSKVADFQELLSMVMDKFNSWGKKSLSMGGMHYVAWSEICKLRSMGGLGLQSPLLRIGSLRSRLAWSFIQKQDSLLHQTLKEKYGDEIMKDDQKLVTSTAWKIMLDGGRNLKNAIRWKDVEEDNIELLKWCSGKTVSALVYEQMLNNRYNLDDVEYFKWLRKLKLSKKVEIFWWRLGKAAIPTNLFLKNLRISLLDSCERGCQVVESYEHIMVHCKYMVEIIKKVREWGIRIPIFNSLEECLYELKRLSMSNSGIAKLYCSVIYLSWKNRNYVKHGKDALRASVVTSNALFLVVSKSSPYLSSWGTNLLRESSNTWCPPPKEWIKINLDASLLTSNIGGIGGVFRDHKGRLICAFGKEKIHWDVAQLEMEAILTVKNFLKSWMMECKGVIIESDNVNIIHFIQDSLKKNNWPLNSGATNEIILGDFNCCRHVHEKEDGYTLHNGKIKYFNNLIFNIGAHDLSSVGHYYTWYNQRTDNPIHIKLDRILNTPVGNTIPVHLISSLTADVTVEEIKDVVFSSPNSSAPGPNKCYRTNHLVGFIKFGWAQISTFYGLLWVTSVTIEDHLKRKEATLSHMVYFGRCHEFVLNWLKILLDSIWDKDKFLERITIHDFERGNRSRYPESLAVLIESRNLGSIGIDNLDNQWVANNGGEQTYAMNTVEKNMEEGEFVQGEIGDGLMNQVPNIIPHIINQDDNFVLIASPTLEEVKKIVKGKIFLWRMVEIIPKIVSEEQVAFVKGRSISDHILLAQEFGGWGLNSAIVRRDSLKAKFAWRIIENPESLLSRNFIGKYGYNWLNNVSYMSKYSNSWKIIHQGWNALSNLVKWKVCDGSKINVLKDTWILDVSLNKWPTFVGTLVDEDLTLDNFINEGSWDVEKLKLHFGEELVKLICNIQFSNYD